MSAAEQLTEAARAAMLRNFQMDECPFCNSTRPFFVSHHRGFYDRRGCLDCDRWIDSMQLNGDKL